MILSADHLAFRVNTENHEKACQMFIDLFGYVKSDEFEPVFSDGTTQNTRCTVLTPKGINKDTPRVIEQNGVKYQTIPEIFISSSTDPNSIVAKYVKNRNDIGNIHHCAFTVENVDQTMKRFTEAGYKFLTKNALVCEELTQTFTEPSDLVGVIFEFLERRSGNFCKDSVGGLMESTKDCK